MPILTPGNVRPSTTGGVAFELWWFLRWFVFHGTRLDRLAEPADDDACEARRSALVDTAFIPR